MKLSISKGNMKLGHIPNLSLPPVVTCRPGVPCAGQCYANKAYRLYPNVKKVWDTNWELWSTNPVDYFGQLQAWLFKHKPEWFRFHVSGDIPDRRYWESLNYTATLFLETKFMLFTKRFDLEFGYIPPSLSVVLSMWPGQAIPEHLDHLPKAWCLPDDRAPASALLCPGNCESCGACWSLAQRGQDVAFKLH
jgi:hypothetical protein